MINEVLSNNFNININKVEEEIPPVVTKEVISNSFNIIINKAEEENTPPTIGTVLVSDEDSKGSYTLTYNAKDSDNDTLTHRLKIGNNNYIEIYPAKDGDKYIYKGTGLSAGVYESYVQISDGKNSVTSIKFTINISKAPTSVKDELRIAKELYDTKFNSLVNTINEIISDRKFDDAEKNLLVIARNEYNQSFSKFGEVSNKAIDSISYKKSKDSAEVVDKKYAQIIIDVENGILSEVGKIENTVEGVKESVSAIDQKADSINISVQKKVDGDKIVSSINMTPESIKINADKIDITGLVTFNDLKNPGATVIHGGNISTNTITAEHISGKKLVGVTLSTKAIGNTGIEISSKGLECFDTAENVCGKIAYDNSGAGTNEEARDRLWIKSLNGYAMKIESGANMSISVPDWYNIYMGGLVHFTDRGISCKKITSEDPINISSNGGGVVLYKTGVRAFEPDNENNGVMICGSSWSPWQSVTAKSTYSMDGIILNEDKKYSKMQELPLEDVLDNINFVEGKSRDSNAHINMDVTGIRNTLFAKVDDFGNVSVNQSELLKLALFEIQKLKNTLEI